jgi:hypothetical protein
MHTHEHAYSPAADAGLDAFTNILILKRKNEDLQKALDVARSDAKSTDRGLRECLEKVKVCLCVCERERERGFGKAVQKDKMSVCMLLSKVYVRPPAQSDGLRHKG